MNAPEKISVQRDRTAYLGGSDIAAVLGLSDYKTPLDVYRQKIGELKDDFDKAQLRRLRRGKQREAFVIQNAADDWGLRVTRTSPEDDQNVHAHQDYPFLRAEVDFEWLVTEDFLDAADIPESCVPRSLVGTVQNGEVKSVHPFAAAQWGEQFSEEVPVYYAAQSMYGLGLTGREICLYLTEIGDDIVLYVIRRDGDTVVGMFQQAVAFWTDHVQARIPPAASTLGDLKWLYGKIKGRPVDVDDDIAQALRNLAALRAAKRANDLAEEDLNFRIGDFVGRAWSVMDGQAPKENAELRHNGVVIATWNNTRGAYLDQKRLKEGHPDIVRDHMVEHFFRVVRIKKS